MSCRPPACRRPVAPLRVARSQMRRIPGGRNVVTVAGAWAQSFGVVAAAAVLNRWWGYLIAFFLMGRAFALLNILGHEAAHRLLFDSKSLNDFVGRWLLAYPAVTPFGLYRRSHMAHHKDEMGPDEPDMGALLGLSDQPGFHAAQTGPRRHRDLRVEESPTPPERGYPVLLAPSGPACARHPSGHWLGGVLDRIREVVAVSAPVARSLDDRLAGTQPPAGHRRACRHAALGRSPSDHPRRLPACAGPVRDGSLQALAGTWPTTWTWAFSMAPATGASPGVGHGRLDHPGPGISELPRPVAGSGVGPARLISINLN